MPEEHRTRIYGDSFKSKMESLDDEKAAFWQPKGNSYPCKVQSERDRIETEEASGIPAKWIEVVKDVEAANAKQIQAKQEMALLVAEQSAENAKTAT